MLTIREGAFVDGFHEPCGTNCGAESAAAIALAFDETVEKLDGEVLYAVYLQADWEGNAYVLLLINGKLHEIEAGHCSCNGLEGSWNPAPTNFGALQNRRFYGAEASKDTVLEAAWAAIGNGSKRP